jgi:hypothetical protein
MGCSGSGRGSFVIWELELLKWGKDTLIQDDSEGKVNILGGDSVSHCAKKKVRMTMFLILNGYGDRSVPFYYYKTFVNDKKGENDFLCFSIIFDRQTCYTVMTNLSQLTIKARKSHRQPQCTWHLVFEDLVLFV